MKTTAFHKYHVAAGAKMAEFAGYDMPIEFTSINDEHLAVRQGAGVFDVSHMGEIWVKGPKALDLLQRITTNDVSKLFPGKVQYSCMPNGRGGIVDDILVYKFTDEKYMLCVNAANTDKDWAHICREGEAFGMRPGTELENASDNICQLAVQGPLAMKIAQKLVDHPVEQMPYYTFEQTEVAGCEAILSITGYTGSGGCEIYAYNADADRLWEALWKAGEEDGPKTSDWVPATRCGWKKDSASTATISTTLLRRSKRDWAGSPSSPRARSSSTATAWNGSRPKG